VVDGFEAKKGALDDARQIDGLIRCEIGPPQAVVPASIITGVFF
jgi:hypothetical protein